MELESLPPIDRALIENRRVLVTGAGGSIGSALVRQAASLAPRDLVLLEASEQGLFQLTQDLEAAYTAVLGSVCDEKLLRELFEFHRFDVVLHAAAFKHVPLLESQAFAAIANNALGTRALVRVAAEAGTPRFVLLSTDKAVEPVSMLGVSKRIAELVTLAAGFTVIRLGNVLASAGSVLPYFQQQLDRGEPLTVTHPEVSRYFVTLADAVHLLLLALGERPQLFVPQMGEPVLIREVAHRLLASISEPHPGIVYTGLRPGEKLNEILVAAKEMLAGRAGFPLRAVITPQPAPQQLSAALDALEAAVQERNLSQLLNGIRLLVPDYRPGEQIENLLAQQARTEVRA
ncbi:hypothetical protein GCM10011586_39250 [Silvibacterium dinghuense]|nr:hypothetical protein GCM10011586_39250 [Silvibacterium dinghuense]